MEDIDYVYLVEDRSWSSSKIVGCFRSEDTAKELAEHMEFDKIHKDGYDTYYVIRIELK